MPLARLGSFALVLTAALSLASVTVNAQEACLSDERRQTLLTWVGEWQVVSATGEVIGSSVVRSILGDCAFEEVRRRADGSEELALTFLDAASGSWRQRWVSNLGPTGLLDLELDGEQLTVRGPIHSDDGELLVRALVSPRAEGGFVQHLETSTDDGATYENAGSILYLPADQAPTAAASAPSEATLPTPVAPTPAEPTPLPTAPTPAAPTASTPEAAAEPPAKVKVRSRRKADAAVPLTEMESPMTLEFELGPLADLPPGAGWRTTELAPYVADNVHIPSVTAQRRERRGEIELELVINLRTRVGQSKVDLDVTLLSNETDVASSREEGIALGKLIRAHDPKTGLAQRVRLSLDSATFAEIFADGKRPTVRLTVAVR